MLIEKTDFHISFKNNYKINKFKKMNYSMFYKTELGKRLCFMYMGILKLSTFLININLLF